MANLWDDVWKQRNVISDYSIQYYRFMQHFSRRLPKRAKVLESGCGSGDSLRCFPEQETYGLDFSQESIKLAKQNVDHAVLGDLFAMPFAANTFDLVYNSGVLEHYKEPKNLAGVKEMARVTKKDGYVIIILPNTLCVWYRIYKWISTQVTGTWMFGYEESYTSARLQHLVKRAGLQIVRPFGLQVLPPVATNRYSLLPLSLRKALAYLDDIFPFRSQYAYGTGVICKKV